MGNDGFWYSVGMVLANRRATKKAIKRINIENAANKGIINYQPSQIEAFFDDREPLGNIIISGGDASIRSRAASRAIECAYIQGFSPVIIYGSDTVFENTLFSYFGRSNIAAVNMHTPLYEPLIGLTNTEITRLIMQSAEKGFEIQGKGRYYINGISDFIKARGITPYMHMYITCPHLSLIDKVNDAEIRGVISHNSARQIISELTQGDAERGNVENFFASLDGQSGQLFSNKSNLPQAFNINLIVKNHGIFAVDVNSSVSTILLNILAYEIESLLAAGKKIFLCIDNLQLERDSKLCSLLAKSGSTCAAMVVSDDVYASFGGEDSLFYSTVGKSTKVVISKHASAYSCQKWSDVIGSYDKKEISNSITGSHSIFGKFVAGTAHSTNINIKRESIIRPEEISRMRCEEVFILNGTTGELAHTTIV